MRGLSTQEVGGAGAFLIGVLTMAFVGLVLFAPQEALEPSEIPWMFVLSDYALALVGLLGLAAIPAISRRVYRLSPGWVRWTSAMAQVGCAVLAIVSVWQAEYEATVSVEVAFVPGMASGGMSYAAEALPASEWEAAWQNLLTRAPQGWLEVTLIGLWIFSVNWLAFSHNLLPQGVVGLGLAAGLLSFGTILGGTLSVGSLQMLGIVSSLLLVPLWFMGVGIVLLRGSMLQRRTREVPDPTGDPVVHRPFSRSSPRTRSPRPSFRVESPEVKSAPPI